MKYIACLAAVGVLSSCSVRSSNDSLFHPEGDVVVVSQRDGETVRGELLAVSDSALTVSSGTTLQDLPISAVRRVSVPAYGVAGAKKAVLIGTVAFFALYLLNPDPAGIVFGVLGMGGSIFEYSRSAKRARFNVPVSPAQMESLRLHARYPQGLTPAQRAELEQLYRRP